MNLLLHILQYNQSTSSSEIITPPLIVSIRNPAKMLKVQICISIVVMAIFFNVDLSLGHPLSLGAALAGHSPPVSVVKDNREPNDGKGNYKYDIELSDGTKLKQEGKTEAPTGTDTEGQLVVTGSYSYVAPDGSMVQVDYKADKDGYHPMVKTQGHA